MYGCFQVKDHLKILKICKNETFLDDYTSSYELLLEKSGTPTMNLARERLLCSEVYKTLNSLNPCLRKNLGKLKEMSVTNIN